MIYSHIYMLSFVISLVLAFKMSHVKHSDTGAKLALMTYLTAFWLFMEGFSYYVPSDASIIILQKAKYISIALIPPILIINTAYFVWGGIIVKPTRLVFLFIVPIITLLSIATNGFPYAFIENVSIYLEGEIIVFDYDRSIGFYIHVLYSYVLTLVNVGLLFYKVIRAPKIYRIQSFFIFLGTFVTLGLNLAFLTGFFGTLLIDTTPISILLTLGVYYWGIFSLPKTTIVPQARNLVIENMSDLVLIVDDKENLIDVNPAAREMIAFGSSLFAKDSGGRLSLSGMPLSQLVKSMEVNILFSTEKSLIDGTVFEILFKDTKKYYRTSIESIEDEDEMIIGSLYIFHDITILQHNLNELLTFNKHLKISDTIISDALEGILISDADNKIIRVNRSTEFMSGYSEDELLGNKPNLFKSNRHDYGFYRDMWDCIIEDGFWEGEIWDRRKNGEIYPKSMSITVIRDEEGVITHYVSISSDITKMKNAEKDIHRMAYYDPLTGFPNRTLFYDRLDTAIQRCKRHQRKMALLYLDLDRFKIINDTYGHSVGDELLIAVSKRIASCIRKADTLCRLGGDEFTLILEDLGHPDEAGIVAGHIVREFDNSFLIQGYELSCLVSIGIAIAPDDDMTSEGLIRKADLAMYHAKEIGGNRYSYSSEDIEQRNKEMNILEMRLKEAAKNNDFVLYLQPQIAMVASDYRIVGAEALIRWPQEDGTMIPPNKFIGLSEKNGLINPIGIWVLEEVQRFNNLLLKEGIHINLAINVSIRQFETDDFYLRLEEILSDSMEEPLNLSIEITESMFFSDVEAGIKILKKIRALGVKIALDDFGTGFSSLSYLNRLPIDYLKIDKSFIDEIETDNPKKLAFMILSMARTLELKTIAEGVEKEQQSEALFNAGCDVIQGYYFGKPIGLTDFIEVYHKYEAATSDVDVCPMTIEVE